MLEIIGVWAAIQFGGSQPPSYDFGGHLVLHAPTVAITRSVGEVTGLGYGASGSGLGASGFALPHLAFVDPNAELNAQRHDLVATARHEQVHLRQYDAIGPGLVLGQLLGGGQVFEDHRDVDGSMWDPGHDPDQRRCPLLRIERGEPRLMPCWNPF